jgi:3-deoxy-D-manno-octulosonic-acid transferase
MSLIYSFFIRIYVLSIRIAGLFNDKARKWTEGRSGLFSRLESALNRNENTGKIAWFHCASLGEFEQGRPVLEAFRLKYPDHRILLTFFSPSGYEIRKNYENADWVFYLPADTKANARRFLDLVNPDKVFFIKYEYWFNFLDVLSDRRIPVYVVSAIFRKGQHFFRWYGEWFRVRLQKITWFFLQDEESLMLLRSIGVGKGSVSGDTRFDRVYTIAGQSKEFEILMDFCGDSPVLLAGSTWPEDEKILLQLINKESGFRFIIAPHETSIERINSLVSGIQRKVLKYSEAAGKTASTFDVLVIDTIGILAYLYRYATVAYIGGGFGAGIHNILEAAAAGVPVIFGPEYGKFREARDLLSLGGAVSIGNAQEFESAFLEMLKNPEVCHKRATICRNYVTGQKGATARILERL